jgi:hypothetical protein
MFVGVSTSQSITRQIINQPSFPIITLCRRSVIEYKHIHRDRRRKKTNNLYVHNICVNISRIKEDDIIDYRLHECKK